MENKIIQKNAIINDAWQVIPDANGSEVPAGKVIIPLTMWNRLYSTLSGRDELPGLLLNSDEDPATFTGNITSLKLIAVNFPAFTDGRGFSLGNLLRDRYHYKGELRACGGLIRDQLYYLKRCGFDSFQFNNDIDLGSALKSLQDFSDNYQMSATEQSPLFRRR